VGVTLIAYHWVKLDWPVWLSKRETEHV